MLKLRTKWNFQTIYVSYYAKKAMANTRNYQKGDLTVVWESKKCIYSEVCGRGLKEVFNPKESPWVNMDGASLQRIREQVDLCPSGALSYLGGPDSGEQVPVQIQMVENGPLMIKGDLKISTPKGDLKSKQKVTAFCRCGDSANKPFCDGSHKTKGFIG